MALKFNFSLKNNKLATYFIILNTFLYIDALDRQGIISLPILKYILSLSSFIYLGYYFRFGIGTKKDAPGVLILIYFSYLFFLFISSISIDSLYIKRLLSARYFITPFLLPIIFYFIQIRTEKLLSLFKRGIELLLVPLLVLGILLIYRTNELKSTWYQDYHLFSVFELCFPLIYYNIQFVGQFKYRFYAHSYVFLMVLFSMIAGRRGMLLEYSTYFIIGSLLLFISSLINLRTKMTLFVVISSLSIFIFFNWNFLQSSFFIFERGIGIEAAEDSRLLVVEDFFSDFNEKGDWTIGRGLDGRVLRTIYEKKTGETDSDTIENGFLYRILKGGLLLLILELMIFFYSIFLGLFNSNNSFSKSSALVVISYIIGMFSFNIPDYSPKYCLLWLCVYINYDSEFRSMTNSKIRNLLDIKR